MSISPQLSDYIAQAKAAGMSADIIRDQLLKAGWAASDVQVALNPGMVIPPTPGPVISKQPQPVKSSRRFVFAGLVVLGILLVAGTGYAYVKNLGPFGAAPYTEKNLVSGLLEKSTTIASGSYTVAAHLAVVPRESDAKPFVTQLSNAVELKTQYEHDARRAQDVQTILYMLRAAAVLPASLEKLQSNTKGETSYFITPPSVTDPVSGQLYAYALTDGGKDFALTVVFETKAAITSIRQGYSFSPLTTLVNGQAVTFTKDSSTSGLYFSGEVPKPFLVELGEEARYLPAEIKIDGTIGATTDWQKAGGEWKAFLDGTGDLGDLTYAVNVEALKKGGIYYFRINKIPSLFLSELGNIKGQWVKVDPAATGATAGSYSEFSSLASELPNAEASYKQNKQQALEMLKKAATFADEEGLFTLKGAPEKTTLDNRTVYKYNLKIRKEAIVPFYKKLLAESATNKTFSQNSLAGDQGLLDYLQSPEFAEVFDYYDKNTSLVVSVDAEGFPAQLEYGMRIVPPDTAVALKDKQAKLSLILTFSGVNQPVTIEAPKDAKLINDLIKQSDTNSSGALQSLEMSRQKARDARRISDMQQIQLGLTVYYDANSTYPNSLSDLVPKELPILPKDPAGLYEYAYNPYRNASWSSADAVAARCSVATPCNGFHLGISLENGTNSSISADDDIQATGVGATIRGGDTTPCNATQSSGSYCYDISNK